MKKFLLKIFNPNKSKSKTLNSLANQSHTYWKFSQTEAGRSQEKNVFTEYKENEITEATDPDKALSFTDENHIVKCFMYGDQLTKLCFSTKNPKFRKIKKTPYKYIGGSFGEYETGKLVTEKNYSLSSKSTIRLLTELIPPDMKNLYKTGWFRRYNSFEERLRNFGFYDSADLLNEIQKNLKNNILLTKENVLKIIDDYKEF